MYPESYPKKIPPNEAKAHLKEEDEKRVGRVSRRVLTTKKTIRKKGNERRYSHHVRLEGNRSFDAVDIISFLEFSKASVEDLRRSDGSHLEVRKGERERVGGA